MNLTINLSRDYLGLIKIVYNLKQSLCFVNVVGTDLWQVS